MSFAEEHVADFDIPPFTPSHRLQNRFLTFADFLFNNLSDFSNPQPPLPPLPPVTFACTDRRIKGRFPRRTAAISDSLSTHLNDPRPDASNLEDVKAYETADVANISAKIGICDHSPLNDDLRGTPCVQSDVDFCDGNVCREKPCNGMEDAIIPVEIENTFDEVNICKNTSVDGAVLNLDRCKDSILIEMPCKEMDVDHCNGNLGGEPSSVEIGCEVSAGTHEDDEMLEVPCIVNSEKVTSPSKKTYDSIQGVAVGECELIEQNKVETDNDLEEGELSEKWIDSESTNSVQEENDVKEIESQTYTTPGNFQEKAQFVKDDEKDTASGFFLTHCFAHNFSNDFYVQDLNVESLSANMNTEKKKKKKTKKKKKINQQKQVTITRADALKVSGVVGLLKERGTKAASDFCGKNKVSIMKQNKGNASVNLLDIPRRASDDAIAQTEDVKEQNPIKFQQSKQCPTVQSAKGILSKAVEEVGLWTSNIEDSQHLMNESTPIDMKPKRVLSAARKKKRQIAKHRKAAQKEEALGIRRLRLKPPTIKKEKQIKFCQFYVKGKCTKGAECTFSHNITPLTKSEMCKYFINNCCLKGEDCPFSHALSTFPCKFFHTRGFCLDAESCRFSHKPITEEKRQELQKKVEKEQQVRQGNSAASDKKLSSVDAVLKHEKADSALFDPPLFVPDFPAQLTVENVEFFDYSDADGVKKTENSEMLSLDTNSDITHRCGEDSTISDDAKSRAMKILQASLEANQHVSKRKHTTTACGINMSSPLCQSSVAQTMFGMPMAEDPKAKAMEILQLSFRNSELMTGKKTLPEPNLLTATGKNEKNGECSGSKTFDTQQSLSSSILLDKFLKPQEVLQPSQTQSNKRATVDSLLSKILNG